MERRGVAQIAKHLLMHTWSLIGERASANSASPAACHEFWILRVCNPRLRVKSILANLSTESAGECQVSFFTSHNSDKLDSVRMNRFKLTSSRESVLHANFGTHTLRMHNIWDLHRHLEILKRGSEGPSEIATAAGCMGVLY